MILAGIGWLIVEVGFSLLVIKVAMIIILLMWLIFVCSTTMMMKVLHINYVPDFLSTILLFLFLFIFLMYFLQYFKFIFYSILLSLSMYLVESQSIFFYFIMNLSIYLSIPNTTILLISPFIPHSLYSHLCTILPYLAISLYPICA
jgi:hypothetical protein